MGPLLMAMALLAESALSFLSIGVQAPAASWGTIILDGEGLIYTRPMVAIAPGLAIVAVVLALNILAMACVMRWMCAMPPGGNRRKDRP